MTRFVTIAVCAAAALTVSAGEASACARAETIFHHGRNLRGAFVAEVLITREGGYQRAEARVLRMIHGPRGVRQVHLRDMPSSFCSYPPRTGQRGVIVAVVRGREGGIPVVSPSLE